MESTENYCKDRREKPNKNKWQIGKKNSFALLPSYSLVPPSVYHFPVVCCSEDYHPSKSERSGGISLVSLHFSHLLSFPFPSPHHFCVCGSPIFLPISVQTSFSTFPSSFLLRMWISFSLIIMIWRFSFSCWPIKTKQPQWATLLFIL